MKNDLIMIVDDMDLAIDILKQSLELAGYTNIQTFLHPTQLFDAVHQGHLPHMVITDYEMPEMNGIQLLDRVTVMYPSIHGLIVTGDTALVRAKTDKYPVLEKGENHFGKRLVEHVTRELSLWQPQ
ncbi:MAG: response regulator [Chitinivibrionales bacterium]